MSKPMARLEQLGYQTEDPTLAKNQFLTGVSELRNGIPKVVGTQTASPYTIRAMTVEMILDFTGECGSTVRRQRAKLLR